MILSKQTVLFLLFSFGLTALKAQDSGATKLSLDDLSAFKPQAGNWMVVGDVTMNPDIEIQHEHPVVAIVPETGKKKKKTKAEAPVVALQAVTFQAGKGVLLNMNSETKKDNLITVFEHGDLELELEVMIPKGSNSGIYLQGRYEVQLLDSWGVRNPKYSDIGGIYRNWENTPGKIYMGKAPISNGAKAAGLWQKMKISFRAPRFDASGNKIANARFVSVELNGVKIHDNVEVPLPTGGPIDSKEVASGPLMIQGDHGPVAFRNISYKLMTELKSSISNVAYKVYHGDFKSVGDFASIKPSLEGSGPSLSSEVIDNDNMYGVVYTGTITVPQNDTYEFKIGYTGGIRFILNGQTVIDNQRSDWRYEKGSITLSAGTYPFEIDNLKHEEWMPPRLSLTVKTPSSYPQTLSAFNSYPPDDDPVSSILIKAGNEPKMLRAFVDFKKDRKQRLTHTIGVAEPSNINYVYDLDAGNLVCVWRGDFVDATPMWHDRGDGSFRPLGVVQWLSTDEPLAILASPNDPFPATGKEGEFKPKGYSIEEGTNRPVFNYTYQGLDVNDKVYPEDDSRSITHEITIKDRSKLLATAQVASSKDMQPRLKLFYKIAEGSDIISMPNGSYAIDDKQYYIKVKGTISPLIREVNGKKELIIPVDGSSLQYSIIW